MAYLLCPKVPRSGVTVRVGFGGERAELELLPKGANALAPAEIPYLLT